MANQVSTIQYNGVEITYSEDRDVWLFTLNGRDRHASTLKNAKAAIDKPAPQDRVPFKKYTAFASTAYVKCGFQHVTVTGAGDHYYGRERVWIVNQSNKRSLECLAYLYCDNEENQKTIADLSAISSEIALLDQRRDVLRNKMIPIEVKAELL